MAMSSGGVPAKTREALFKKYFAKAATSGKGKGKGKGKGEAQAVALSVFFTPGVADRRRSLSLARPAAAAALAGVSHVPIA